MITTTRTGRYKYCTIFLPIIVCGGLFPSVTIVYMSVNRTHIQWFMHAGTSPTSAVGWTQVGTGDLIQFSTLAKTTPSPSHPTPPLPVFNFCQNTKQPTTPHHHHHPLFNSQSFLYSCLINWEWERTWLSVFCYPGPAFTETPVSMPWLFVCFIA